MVPIPQYPLYSASLAEFNMHQIGYYLDESKNWGLSIAELEVHFLTDYYCIKEKYLIRTIISLLHVRYFTCQIRTEFIYIYYSFLNNRSLKEDLGLLKELYKEFKDLCMYVEIYVFENCS